MRVDVWVHADRDTNYNTGASLGFKGTALNVFSFLGYEHKLTFEVNDTGHGTIVAVDGKDLMQ